MSNCNGVSGWLGESWMFHFIDTLNTSSKSLLTTKIFFKGILMILYKLLEIQLLRPLGSYLKICENSALWIEFPF